MINPEELAICLRRGHAASPVLEYWTQCRCGMWLREVRTTEESEEKPADAEQE
jgi:hypothetical protein